MRMTNLININPERDGVLAVDWINRPGGSQMLQLMGMFVPDDFTTTVANERARLIDIVNSPNELAWMIEHDDHIIGIVELHIKNTNELKAPNISIMIGDAHMRGKGIGTEVIARIIEITKERGDSIVYARALTRNNASQKMMTKAGFIKDGSIYIDADGLEWQNFKKLI